MSNMKVYGLLCALLERTEENKLSWEVTAWDSKFITGLVDYTVGINEEEGSYYLTIENGLSEVIDYITDDDLYEIDGNSHAMMRALYGMARRNARGADKAIDDILRYLQ